MNLSLFVRLIVWVAIITSLLMANSALAKSVNDEILRQAIGQKLMIDIRFYCEKSLSSNTKKACRTPMVTLPNPVAQTIKSQHIGGVILFSENLQSTNQIRTLTSDLQNAGAGDLPLFIATDQEGGRVARLPLDDFEAFSGNMPLGAVYQGDQQLGKKLTAETYKALAHSLRSVGINVNFAPNIDVNNNPNNPVINIRSFSDNPEVVSNLGKVAVNAMQQQGVMAALKHFPGHGDTVVDSHSGLPLVNHPKSRIKQVELKPFNKIIAQTQPAFVMSAHIQFPALDPQKLTTKTGETIITPATFSKPILTDLLRNQIGFEGLVITDALDMRAISDSFSSLDAVVKAFNAGADIALMPMVIDSNASLIKLSQLIDQLVLLTKQGVIDKAALLNSYQRIITAKKAYITTSSGTSTDAFGKKITNLAKTGGPNVSERPSIAHWVNIDKDSQRILARKVAEASVVTLSTESVQPTGIVNTESTQPSAKSKVKPDSNLSPAFLRNKIGLIVMPDSGKCDALIFSLAKLGSTGHTCWNDKELNEALKAKSQLNQALKEVGAVLVSNLSPAQAAYEMVGVSMEEKRALRKLTTQQRQQNNQQLLSLAKQTDLTTAMVSLRAPYDLADYQNRVNYLFATMSYRVSTVDKSVTFEALAKALLGQLQNNAQIPVNIDSV